MKVNGIIRPGVRIVANRFIINRSDDGFIRRYIRSRSIYDAFYGSSWWWFRVPIVWHIGYIILRFISWKNSGFQRQIIDWRFPYAVCDPFS